MLPFTMAAPLLFKTRRLQASKEANGTHTHKHTNINTGVMCDKVYTILSSFYTVTSPSRYETRERDPRIGLLE